MTDKGNMTRPPSNPTRWVALAAALWLIAIGAGCGASESEGTSEEAIAIGYVGTLSGPVSFLGQAPLEGVEMAIEELNADGGLDGHTFELITEDDHLDPSQAAAATQKLINNDGAEVIIGSPHSGMSQAMIPVSEAAQVVQLSPLSAAPELTDPVHPYFYRLWNTDTSITDVIADHSTKRFDRVALLYETSAFGEGGRDAFKTAFEQRGEPLVAMEAFDLDAQDLTPQLTKIRGADADAIIVQTQGPQAALAARGLEQLGSDVPIIGHPGLAQKGFVDLAGDAAEGAIVFEGLDRTKPEAKKFIAAYEAKYGKDPFSFYPATGYDAMMVIADALEQADFDLAGLHDAMDELSGFRGVVGRSESEISYGPSDHDGYGGDALIPKVVKNGQLHPAPGG